MNAINYVMERLGNLATEHDAAMVLELAEKLAVEQGEVDYDAINWLSNRTYAFTDLYDAANGDVSALAKVRAEAGLSVI